MAQLKHGNPIRRETRAAIKSEYATFMSLSQLARLFKAQPPRPVFKRYPEGTGLNGTKCGQDSGPWGLQALKDTIGVLAAANGCPHGFRQFGAQKRHAAAWKFGPWLSNEEVKALLHAGLPGRNARANVAGEKPKRRKAPAAELLQKQQSLLSKRQRV